jgi:hypothetical protein
MKESSISLFLCFLMFALSSIGQNRKSYKGEFENINREPGLAEFFFIPSDEGEEIKDGPFSFVVQFVDPLDCNRLISKTSTGKYKKGQKEGLWEYEYKTFAVSNKISGSRILSSYEGIAGTLSAGFLLGQATGLWTINEDRVSSGRIGPKLVKGTANFKNGKLSGPFSLTESSDGKSYTVTGRFNQDGDFDGTWKVAYSINGHSLEETRVYDAGFLISIKKINKSTGVSENQEYHSVREKLSQLKASKDALSYKIGEIGFDVLFDDGFAPDSKQKAIQIEGNTFITAAMGRFCSPSSEPFALQGVSKVLPGTTRRFQYFFSPSELNAIEIIEQKLSVLNQVIDSLLNDKAFAINYQRNEKLALAYEFFKSAENKTRIIENQINLIKSEMFLYKSRQNYFQNGIEGLQEKDTILYAMGGEKKHKEIHYGVSLNSGEEVIEKLAAFTQSLLSHAMEYKAEVSPMLENMRQERTSLELEEKMLELINAVKAIYDVQPINRPDAILHQLYQDNISAAIHKLMQQYSNMLEFGPKQEKANEIINVLQALIKVEGEIRQIPVRKKRLDELFTTYAYNPWTGEHDIPEKKKRRIYQKGAEELWPYLYEQMKSEQTISGIINRANELANLYNRMAELVKKEDAETKKLEQKLRRENDPEKIKKLIGI